MVYVCRKVKGVKGKKRTVKKGAKPKRAPVKEITAIVKRVINRQFEKKTIALIVANRQSFFQVNRVNTYDFPTYKTFGLSDIYDLITQGTGQANRIGNRVTLKSSKINYTIVSILNAQNPLDGQITNVIGPFYVVALCLKRKDGVFPPSAISVGTSYLKDLFQFGNDTAAPMTRLEDLHLNINKDVYKVLYKRIFKMFPPMTYSGEAPTAPTTVYMSDASSKMAASGSIDLLKHMKANLNYEDEGADVTNSPNVNAFMVFLPVAISYEKVWDAPDNEGAGEFPWLMLKVSIQHQITYTDA